MRIRSGAWLGAFGALMLGLSPHQAAAQPMAPDCAGVSARSYAPAIHSRLPVRASDGDRALARFAMPYALMAASSEDETYLDDITPFGFVPGPDSVDIFSDLADGSLLETFVTGYHGDTFFHCREGTIVVVNRAMSNLDVRDWISGLVRHSGTGEAPLALKFFDTVRALFPGYDLVVVGHSAAGGMTSFVAAERNAPSVVFNPSVTDAALRNDGGDQLIVYVNGDVLSDPAAPRPDTIMAVAQDFVSHEEALAGTVLRVDPPPDYQYIYRLHQMDILIAGLEDLID